MGGGVLARWGTNGLGGVKAALQRSRVLKHLAVSMLHVLDINNFFSFTGGGVRTYHLQKMAWAATQPDLLYTLIVPDDHYAAHREGNVQRVHFPAVAIPGAENYRYILDLPQLTRVLTGLKPDLIEVGSPYILPWLVPQAARATGAVICGFWHADYPRAYVERPLSEVHPALGPVGREAAWWYARQTYGRFAATFAAAECVVDGLWEHGVPRVFQTPLGVDIERFHPRHRSAALRASVGASDDRPVVFFPHRLIEEKDLSTVLAAWPAIYAAHRPVLVFAGVGPGKPKLDAFMAQQADVHYLGYLSDPAEMAAWYASSDAIFALSPFETFGLSAAEAMASGAALIGADAGAINEWIARAGCGERVRYQSVQGLIDATLRLLQGDNAREAGARGHAFAQQHFSWDAAFTRLFGCYREVLAAPDPYALPQEPRRWVV